MTLPKIENKLSDYGESVTSISVTMSGVKAGSALVGVACHATSNTRSFTFSDDKANTWEEAVRKGTSRQSDIEYALNAVAGDTIVACTANFSASWTIAVFEVSGVSTLGATGSVTDASNVNDHPCSADPGISTNANCFIIAAGQMNASTGTITANANFTEQYQSTTLYHLVQTRISATALSDQQAIFTTGTARVSQSAMAEFYGVTFSMLPILQRKTNTLLRR